MGERLAWYELAWTLRMPVGLVMRCTSSTQFVEWMEFLRMKLDQVETTHWYLAQLAKLIHDIRFMFSRSKKKSEIKDFLIKFKMIDEKPKAAEEYPKEENLTQEQKNQITQKSKLFWGALLGKFGKTQPRGGSKRGQRARARKADRSTRH